MDEDQTDETATDFTDLSQINFSQVFLLIESQVSDFFGRIKP